MTADLIAAHQAVIEAADRLDVGLLPEHWPIKDTETLTKAIIAYRAIDPTGSELARLAAIGAAVERLPSNAYWAINNAPYPQRDDDEAFTVTTYPGARQFRGETIPQAITAALGEEP